MVIRIYVAVTSRKNPELAVTSTRRFSVKPEKPHFGSTLGPFGLLYQDPKKHFPIKSHMDQF